MLPGKCCLPMDALLHAVHMLYVNMRSQLGMQAAC